MVRSISPTYYASQQSNTGFVLEGEHFGGIPMDAVGIYANSNDSPLAYAETQDSSLLYDIAERSDTRIRLVAREPGGYHPANYLGGLVSPDGSIVYWVNDTRPLP